jgi:hypothetical protein
LHVELGIWIVWVVALVAVIGLTIYLIRDHRQHGGTRPGRRQRSKADKGGEVK